MTEIPSTPTPGPLPWESPLVPGPVAGGVADFGEPWPPPSRRGSRALAVAAMAGLALASAGAGVVLGMRVQGTTASPHSQSSVLLPSSPLPPSQAPATGAGGAAGTGLDVAAIAARVDPAVADITARLAGGSGTAAGTGMVLTASGQVLTNHHVIAGAATISAQIDGSGRTYTARVITDDPAHDVALLQLDNASGLPTVSLGDSSRVAVGDQVVALGNALGLGGTPAAASGSVSAIDQTITASDTGGTAETLTGMIEVNAAIRPGDSGGPVVNSAGEVVGMTTAGSGVRGRRRVGASLGYAIPINDAKAITQETPTGPANGVTQSGQRALLGVQVADPGSPGATAPVSAGALVVGVEPGRPAESAGLVSGDVIVSLGGVKVASAAGLGSAISAHHPGDRVAVGWVDAAAQHRNATVSLAAAAAA